MTAPIPCTLCGYDLTGLAERCPECGCPILRFTDRARAVLAAADRHANRLLRAPRRRRRSLLDLFRPARPNSLVQPAHLLLGLLTGPEGAGHRAVHAISGRPPATLAQELDCVLPTGGRTSWPVDFRHPLDLTTRRVLRAALDEASRLGVHWVGTEHLLLALTLSLDDASGWRLEREGVTYDAVLAYVRANPDRLRREASDGHPSAGARVAESPPGL